MWIKYRFNCFTNISVAIKHKVYIIIIEMDDSDD